MFTINSRKLVYIIVPLITLCLGFVLGVYTGIRKGVPFVKYENTNWAIGIYVGDSPLNMSSDNIENPVLTAQDVTDISAAFVADPFMVNEKDIWYMFFEVWNSGTNQGDIAFATSSNGLNWTYKAIVLDESFHLSYPYIFKWQDEYYMLPETNEARSVRLYKAVHFPSQWSFVGILLKGGSFKDSSIFHYNKKWWLFTETNPEHKCDTLRLYYAENLLGPWIEHPNSSIVMGNPKIARPGGRVFYYNGRIIRNAQDDATSYGKLVRAFEIIELTTSTYRETELSESPILEPSGRGWNARRMHNIDVHQWDSNKYIACVDGKGEKLVFGLQY